VQRHITGRVHGVGSLRADVTDERPPVFARRGTAARRDELIGDTEEFVEIDPGDGMETVVVPGRQTGARRRNR
jgi:hypothetical protein